MPSISEAIGILSDADGPVTLVRADGSTVEAEPGTEIFPGDTVITGDGGAAYVTLADGGELRLDEFGEMVVEGADAVTVIQGGFVVIAEGAVLVQTPSAVVTVDGATLVGLARPEGEQSHFTLLPNPDGSLGLVEVATEAGSQLLLQPYQTTTTLVLAEAPGPVVVVSAADFSALYADALGVLGDLAVETAGGGATSEEAPSGPVSEPVEFDISSLDSARDELFSLLFDDPLERLSSPQPVALKTAEVDLGGGGEKEPPIDSPGARSFLSEDESETAAPLPDFVTDAVFYSDMQGSFETLFGNFAASNVPSTGDDILTGDGTFNVFYADAGNDILFGNGGADQLNGGGGNDFLFGDTVTFTFDGRSLVDPTAAGDDTLDGGLGNDYLEGNHGNDALIDAQGDDSYAWGSGWGRDAIWDENGNDRLGLFQDLGRGFLPDDFHDLQIFTLDTLDGGSYTATCEIAYAGLGMMYLPVDIKVYRSGDDLVIDDLRTPESDGVRIYQHFAAQPIEQILFDDFTLSMTVTDALTGTAGDDFQVGSGAGETLSGGGGRDAIYGGAGNDSLIGGADRDFLVGGPGRDYLDGGAGDDYLAAGLGGDTLDGGEGLDWLSLASSRMPFWVELQAGAALDFGNPDIRLIDIENVRGTAYDDYIFGDEQGNEFLGYDGSDLLWGYGGTDFLWGMGGGDRLDGGDGADVLVGDYGSSQAPPGSAPAGDDYIFGGGSDDYLFGNGGNDSLAGGDGDDRLFGEQGNDTLLGGAGNDFLRDDSGFNTLDAGAGDDILFGRGANTLIGGSGNDTVYYADAGEIASGNSGGPVAVNLSQGSGTYGAISHTLSGIENVVGTQQNDLIYGNFENNILRGLNGNDLMRGGVGDDVLMGGAGNDIMSGDGGSDTLSGGSGRDYLVGGDGSDFYIYGATRNSAGDAAACNVFLSATFGSLSEFGPLDGGGAPAGLALDDIELISDSGGAFDAVGFGSHAWVDSLSQLSEVGPERLTAFRQGDDLIIRDVDATGEALDEFHSPVLVTVNAGVDIINHYGGGEVEFFLFESRPGDVFGFEAAGTAESDFLVGGDGFDFIDGGADDDLLFGNGAADILIGGGGDDMLRGGEGGDRFVFEDALDGHDVIVDFNPAEGDWIDLDVLFDTLGTDVVSRDAAVSFADTADGLNLTVAGAADFSVTFSGWDVASMTPDFAASIVTDLDFGD